MAEVTWPVVQVTDTPSHVRLMRCTQVCEIPVSVYNDSRHGVALTLPSPRKLLRSIDSTYRFFLCRNASGGAPVCLCALCGHPGPRQWGDEDPSNGLAGVGAVPLRHQLRERPQELHQASRRDMSITHCHLTEAECHLGLTVTEISYREYSFIAVTAFIPLPSKLGLHVGKFIASFSSFLYCFASVSLLS